MKHRRMGGKRNPKIAKSDGNGPLSALSSLHLYERPAEKRSLGGSGGTNLPRIAFIALPVYVGFRHGTFCFQLKQYSR